MVSANENFAFGQPAVSRVVLRDVTVLLLRDLPGLNLKISVFVLIVLVGLVACYENDSWVGVAEGDLRAYWVTSWVLKGLIGDTALLVNLPNIDRLLRFS